MSTRSKTQRNLDKNETTKRIPKEATKKPIPTESRKKRKNLKLDGATTSSSIEINDQEISSPVSVKKRRHNILINNVDLIDSNIPKPKVPELSETGSKSKRKSKKIVNSGGTRTSLPEGCNKFVGAHTSIAGGLANAVFNALSIKGQSFGLFLRSQRSWATKPLDDDAVKAFKKACQDFNYPPHLIIPHGSYLMNCGSPNQEALTKSRAALVDELKRCEMLGLTLYNFHPGSTCGEISIAESMDRIAESINQAHVQTQYTITVIENMCGQGNTLGGDFKELRGIIDMVTDKSRIGVCLDTCHAFAAGYDLSKEEGYKRMMSDFETIVGLQYLKAAHLNDSKGEVGCHLDRHENIGRGKIGLGGFKRLMNDPRFDNIPLILETPQGLDDAEEIKILYSLIDKTLK